MILFSFQTNLPEAILCLVLFSSSVQASEGSTFGMTAYPLPKYMGAVAGLVGAGGNIGAVIWGFVFKVYVNDPRQAFLVLGCVVLALTLLTIPLLRLTGSSVFTNPDKDMIVEVDATVVIDNSGHALRGADKMDNSAHGASAFVQVVV